MILLYLKPADDIDDFGEMLKAFSEETDIRILTESRRSFSKLDNYRFAEGDIIAAADIYSFGLAFPDIEKRISLILSLGVFIALVSCPATYEYGFYGKENEAAVQAVIQVNVKSLA